MPPILALCFGFAFAFWLLAADMKWRRTPMGVLWIPFLWMAVRCSRPVTLWLSGSSPGAGGGGGDALEGSPIDRLFALVLMISAFIVLCRQSPGWFSMLTRAWPLFFLFGFLLLSIAWAPYPFVALKRWSKELGAVLIAMIILTRADPAAALRQVLIRISYFHFPLSIVLTKYYPSLGREYSMGGHEMVTGVTTQKNTLGQVCVVLCIVLLWELLELRRLPADARNRRHRLTLWIAFGLGVFMLLWSRSATALMGFIIALPFMLLSGVPFVRRAPSRIAHIGLVAVCGGLIVASLWSMAAAPLLEALGRDSSLTGRTRIWDAVLRQDINPWIGSGFYSFWLDKGESVWSEFQGMFVNTAHSGYIETYLDSGWIGCFLLAILILSVGRRLAQQFSFEDPFARVLYVFVLVSILMNYSESYFFRLGPLWFSFIIASLAAWSYPRPVTQPSFNPPGSRLATAYSR